MDDIDDFLLFRQSVRILFTGLRDAPGAERTDNLAGGACSSAESIENRLEGADDFRSEMLVMLSSWLNVSESRFLSKEKVVRD